MRQTFAQNQRLLVAILSVLAAGVVACSDPDIDTPREDDETDTSETTSDAGMDATDGATDALSTDTEGSAVEEPDTSDPEPFAAGACNYVNGFSNSPECKEYVGEEWDQTSLENDCATAALGGPGELTVGEGCDPGPLLGICTTTDDDGRVADLYVQGEDAGSCDIAKGACENFTGGTFTAEGVCVDGGGTGGGVTPGGVFMPPELICQPPLDGDEGVASDEVCTWNMISACTEEGLQYADYGSCDDVLTQRPYAGFTYPFEADSEDPRLDDEEFQTELAWITDQVEACACVCCHSSDLAPAAGASGWFLEASDIWTDSVPDEGIAIFAGLADSTAFGAYDPDQNNGFQRTVTGLPSNDAERMRTFFLNEWIRRGFTEADAEEIPAFGGPLVSQARYEPEPCAGTIGVSAEGVLEWGGTDARYVYIMESGSANPGVPPNLDLPDGTLWRVDVLPTGTPVSSGMIYGEVPGGAIQNFPADDAAPAPLMSGEDYYIYVMLDVGFPLARCIFTYEG
jgi:hypothetical protein